MLGRKKGYSPLLLVFILIDSAMLLYLSWKGVESGLFYFFMVLFTGVMLFLSYLFLGESEEKMILKLPFKKNLLLGSTAFLLGSAIPLIMNVFKISTEKIMSPFFLFSQSLYQAFALGSSSLFNWLITVPTASIQEELTFGVLATLVGILIGYVMFIKMFGLNFGAKGNFAFSFVIGMIVSVITFTLAHSFNPTYTTQMFIVAAGFRVLMNIAMWFVLGVEFTVGYHLVNNWIALSGGMELNPVIWIISAFMYVPVIFLVIRNFRKIKIEELITNTEVNGQ